MKSLIVYYSSSGNTTQVAYKFFMALSKKGIADIYELSYRSGRKGLLGQLLDRLTPFRIDLGDVPLDVKDYDLLCLGIPVWAGRPAPLMGRYVQQCKNIAGKKIICFHVCGVEASARRCLEYVKRVLDKKGHPEIIGIIISWLQVSNAEFIDGSIRETLDKLKI